MAPTYGAASQSSSAASASGSGNGGGGGGGGAGAAGPGVGPSRPATREDMLAIRSLVQRVARLFYEDKHIIVMDRLVKFQVVPADALAGLLGVAAKDVAAMCSKLIDDRLICVHRRAEAREGFGATRPTQRSYYYLDYASLLNVLKWRLLHMRRTIESGLMADLHTRGFVCPRCTKRFATLDVMHLLDPSGTTLICDTPGCGAELKDNEDAEDVRRSKDRMMRFNEQCGGVLDALKHVDDVVLPRLDVTSWIIEHGSTWRQAPPSSTGTKGSTALLPSSDDITISTGGAQAAPSLQVDLTSSDPAVEAAKRAHERAQAEEKRRQNQLPEWLQRSTVSGEHTGVGKQANAADHAAVDEETRKKEEDDYYAQYASLQAAQAASAATTSGEATPVVQEDDDDDDLDLEDVDVSAAASTTAAAANGKRAREEEQEAQAKRARSDAAAAAEEAAAAQQVDDDDEDEDDMEEVI